MLLRKTRKSFDSFKNWAQSTRILPPGTALTAETRPDDLVYEINPVYLEIGQGTTSPMRGWGLLLLLPGYYLGFRLPYAGITMISESYKYHELSALIVGGSIFIFIAGLFGLMICVLMTLTPFVTLADSIVRFDYKRKKAWMCIGTGEGIIECNWKDLVPCISQTIASPVSSTHLFRAVYAELDSSGLPMKTGEISHAIQCGQIAATPEVALQSLEFVRRYMTTGNAEAPIGRKLRRTTPWWAMVNFLGLAQWWVDWKENRDRPDLYPAPIWGTVFAVLLFPLLFPLQITNWLALILAPKAKWPADIAAMHAADLEALKHGL